MLWLLNLYIYGLDFYSGFEGDWSFMKSKKSPRKRLEDKLDELWRSVGKPKARCEICETLPPEKRVNYTKLDAHHIVGRTNKVLRWDLKNRLWVDPHHHTLGKPSEIVQDNLGGWFLNWESDNDWMGKHRPADKEYLRERHTIPYKQWTMDELEEILKELNAFSNK